MRRLALTVILIAATCVSLSAAEIQFPGPWSSAPQWATPSTAGDVDFRSEGFSASDNAVRVAQSTMGTATARAGINQNTSVNSTASAGMTFSREFVLTEPTCVRLTAILDGQLELEDTPGGATVNSSAWVTDLATGKRVDDLRIDCDIFRDRYFHARSTTGSDTIYEIDRRTFVLAPGRYKVEGKLIATTSIDWGYGNDRATSDFSLQITLTVDQYTCSTPTAAGVISCTSSGNRMELSYVPPLIGCNCTKIVFIQVSRTLVDGNPVLPSGESPKFAYQDIDTVFDAATNRYYTVDYVQGENDPYYNGDDRKPSNILDGGTQGTTGPPAIAATMVDTPTKGDGTFPGSTTQCTHEFETFAYCAAGVDAGTYYTGLAWVYTRTKGASGDGVSTAVEPLGAPSAAFLAAVAKWAELRAPTNLRGTAGTTTVALEWEDNSHVEDGFIIERRTAGGTWAEAGRVGQNVNKFQDNDKGTGLKAGTTYEYRVRAYSNGRVYMPGGLVLSHSSFTPTMQSTTQALVRFNGYGGMLADARIVPLDVCGTPYEWTDVGVQGGALYVVRIEEPLGWNPLTAHDTGTTWFTNRMYRGLVSRDPLSGAIVPDFAKSYEVSEDGMVLTFHLREEMRWSDGEPMTAYDVLFTFNDLILNEDVDCDWRDRLLLPDWSYPVCDVIDDYTVVFAMSVPFRPTLSALSFPILPEHALSESVHLRNPDVPPGTFNDTWTLDTPLDELVCNGPWIVADYMPDVGVTMEANPYYYGYDPNGTQLPYYDNVVAVIVANQDVSLLKFRNGEIDVYALRPQDIPILLPEGDSKGFTVSIGEEATYERTWLALNQDIGLFDGTDAEKRELYRDVQFREAIAHCIDKDTIVTNVFNGLATPQWSPIPMVSPFYAGRDVYGGPITENNAVFFYYDEADAADLLDNLGIVDQDGDGWRDLWSGAPLTMLIETRDDTDLIACCLILQDALQMIGLNADFEVVDTASLVERFFASAADIWVFDSVGSNEPNDDSAFFRSYGSLHGFRYSARDEPSDVDLRIDELMDLAAGTFDLDEAFDYYVEMQQLLAGQLGYIPMCQPTFQYAYYNHVGNASLASPISSPDGPDSRLMELCFDWRLMD